MNPTRHARRRLLLATGLSPLSAAWWPATAVARDNVSGAWDAVLRKKLTDDAVGLVGVLVSAQGVRFTPMGLMRQGSSDAITEQTLFELGSMTKAFVALALADGVLRGHWSLDDPVEDALPEGLKLRDLRDQPVRLIDLATHRSGLPRMPTNIPAREMADPYAFYSEKRLHDFLRTWRPNRSRGDAFEYSNLGYGLLALVLARRAGVSVDALLATRVLQPLGLVDMQLRRPIPAGDDLAAVSAAIGAALALAPREAIGHTNERKPTPAWRFDALAGAIGLAGTAKDLGRFMQAALGLIDHPLREAFAMCLQQRTEGESPLHPFGLAWEQATVVTASQRRTLFNQDGATQGFSSSMWIEPARRQGAALLCNTFTETRSVALAAIDPPVKAIEFNRMHLPGSAMKGFTGPWVGPQKMQLTLRVAGDRAFGQFSDNPEFEVLPIGPTRFFLRQDGLTLEFDQAERPGQLTLRREGTEVVLRRPG